MAPPAELDTWQWALAQRFTVQLAAEVRDRTQQLQSSLAQVRDEVGDARRKIDSMRAYAIDKHLDGTICKLTELRSCQATFAALICGLRWGLLRRMKHLPERLARHSVRVAQESAAAGGARVPHIRPSRGRRQSQLPVPRHRSPHQVAARGKLVGASSHFAGNWEDSLLPRGGEPRLDRESLQ